MKGKAIGGDLQTDRMSSPRWQRRMRTASHHVTWWLGRRFPDVFPLVFVLGYPKSGTTWACQVVSDYLQLPFPRYSLLPIGCPAVVHGHEFVDSRYARGVYTIRDGRDVLVSRYFHFLREVPDGDNPPIGPELKRVFGTLRNREDARENLPKFLNYVVSSRNPLGHWGNHLRSYFEGGRNNFVLWRYEDMVSRPEEALAKCMGELTGIEPNLDRVELAVRQYSFSAQKKRPELGARAKRFLRKGKSGDWRNHFTPELAAEYDRHFGDMLVAAGYEADRSWVKNFRAADPDNEPSPAAATGGSA